MIPTNEVELLINEAIATTLLCDIAIIEPNTTLEDIGVDSLSAIELVMELEDVFGVLIPDEEAEVLLTVNSIYLYIKNLLK